MLRLDANNDSLATTELPFQGNPRLGGLPGPTAGSLATITALRNQAERDR
jgi:hypothetical protein